MKTNEQERARLWRLAGGAVDRLWKYLDKHKWGRSKDERLVVDARSMQQIVSDALAEAVVGAEPGEQSGASDKSRVEQFGAAHGWPSLPSSAEQAMPRRWAEEAWAVVAYRKGKWLILPGRYETKAGAELTAEFARLGGKCLVAVVAGPVEPESASDAETTANDQALRPLGGSV